MRVCVFAVDDGGGDSLSGVQVLVRTGVGLIMFLLVQIAGDVLIVFQWLIVGVLSLTVEMALLLLQ